MLPVLPINYADPLYGFSKKAKQKSKTVCKKVNYKSSTIFFYLQKGNVNKK